MELPLEGRWRLGWYKVQAQISGSDDVMDDGTRGKQAWDSSLWT
jgi:hypothetical protein